jgi:hypothetical protein
MARRVVQGRGMSDFVGDPMQLGKLRDGALDGIRIDEIGEPAHGLFLDYLRSLSEARNEVPCLR